MEKIKVLQQIARKLRIHSLKMTTAAGSGHPTTCLSMAELTACLFFDEMQYNINDPFDWSNDEFVLSKGHAAPILWAAYAEAGIFPKQDLMDLRKISSPLEGHPTPRMPWIKAATGSLGQGLSVGVGLAAAMKCADVPRRVYVVMGDGECAEGAVWEAANAAHLFKLDNLCAIMDINRLAQSGPTMHEHHIAAYEKKFAAFGWETMAIDGHDIVQILDALAEARKTKVPSVILAKTFKGKGISFLEDKNGFHGKPLSEEQLADALKEIGPIPEVDARIYVRKPKPVHAPDFKKKLTLEKSSFPEKTATRKAFGQALVNLGKINPAVVALDGDVKNSTYTEDFFNAFPERSFQNYIAEQNMVGMGIGLAAKGYLPFMATFAAFLTRAHDQIRMAAYSMSNIKLVGSHVGISIGEDGPSQMGLEDLAVFSPIPECLILYPSDARSAEACVQNMAEYNGMAYLRTTRPKTPVIYDDTDTFPVGGSKVIRKSSDDKATVIAAGITVFEALKAYDLLQKENISIRVIDAYSIKPFDAANVRAAVEETGGRAVIVEDHFPEGGLFSAAGKALQGLNDITHLAVMELPRSGKPDELMDKYGISAAHIVKAVKNLI
jgi:transketolase